MWVILIVVIIIGVAFYFFSIKKEVQTQVIQDKYEEAFAKRKAEEQATSPAGYLVPGIIPSGYLADRSQRFTSHSTYYSYKAQKITSFGQMTAYLQFKEDENQKFDEFVARETTSTVQFLRVVKDFTYRGNKGVIIGTFINQKNYESRKSNEYWLAYDHDGRLFTIHTTDGSELTPDKLIELLKSMSIAK